VTPLPSLPKGKGRVYLLTGNPGEEKAELKVVDIGVTDGLRTELVGDPLGIGTKIVTDESDDDKKKKKGLF
jgi:hypothetical protein